MWGFELSLSKEKATTHVNGERGMSGHSCGGGVGLSLTHSQHSLYSDGNIGV